MTTAELTNYVRKRLRKGYPAGELRHELLRQGYAESMVDAAFTPRRQWHDPTQGFGLQQWWGPLAFVGLGLARLTANHFWQSGTGLSITGISCLLIFLLYRYER